MYNVHAVSLVSPAGLSRLIWFDGSESDTLCNTQYGICVNSGSHAVSKAIGPEFFLNRQIFLNRFHISVDWNVSILHNCV